MKNEEFASASVSTRRSVLIVLLLFNAVANYSFFIPHSSFPHSSFFIPHSSFPHSSFFIPHSSFPHSSFFIFHSSFSHSSFFIPHSSFISAQTQRGIASYYAKKATGRRTASGELLHHDSLTCAHRTYPFGTLLKVTNPANDRIVVVRVTDRGPYSRGRVIDLSWGAARELGILQQGIASVVVEPVSQTIVPMKDTTQIKLPELELATPVSVPDMTPVWQDTLQVDHPQVRRQMVQTAEQTKLRAFIRYLEEKLGY